ncbi:MAG: hypothetical protein O3B87_03050 [bacterium]|nr:hypothetical protein [bacterium]
MMQGATTNSNRFTALIKTLFRSPFTTMPKPKTFLLIVVAIGVIAGLFWFMNTYIRQFFASEPIVQTVFTPSKSPVNPGDEFSINLQLSGETITAADVYITYTSDKVQYISEVTQGQSGFSQLTEYFDSPPFIEEVEVTDNNDNTKTLHLVLVSEKGDSDVAQFSLKFKAQPQASGDALFTIDTTRSKLSGSVGTDLDSASYISFPDSGNSTTVPIAEGAVEPTNTPTPSPTITQDQATPTPTPSTSSGQATLTPDPSVSPTETPTPTPTITQDQETPTPTPSTSSGQATPTPTTVAQNSNVTLDMKVRLQGVVKQPIEPYRQQEGRVLVQSNDKSFKQEQIITLVANGDGIWTGSVQLTNVPIEKEFNIYVKGSKHLQRKICNLNPTESILGQYDCTTGQIKLKEGTNVVDMSGVYVLAGDLPVQNGIVDSVDIIYIRNNLGSTNPAVVTRADLNFDGIVDTQDYSLVIVALGFKYDEK